MIDLSGGVSSFTSSIVSITVNSSDTLSNLFDIICGGNSDLIVMLYMYLILFYPFGGPLELY